MSLQLLAQGPLPGVFLGHEQHSLLNCFGRSTSVGRYFPPEKGSASTLGLGLAGTPGSWHTCATVLHIGKLQLTDWAVEVGTDSRLPGQ